MPPLKNLELEFPLVDSKFRQFCSSHGIFSVEDFLVNDLYSLAGYAEGEPTCEKLKQAIAQVLTIIDQQHQPWCNGLALLEDQQMRKRFLPTGCKKVDLLLRGGLREGEVVELVGLSSSGKTQEQESRFHRTMSSISCMPVFDIYELLGSLNWLSTTLKHQAKNEALRLRLVVIDSISSLIAPVLGGQNSQGRSLMVSVGYALKKLAYEYNICVLVTNHMVGGEGGVPKPALGESWKMVPHVRLLLSRDRGGCGFCVSVLKHASMPPGRPAKFAFRGDQEIEVEADRPPTESTTAREEHVDAPPPFFATRGSTCES